MSKSKKWEIFLVAYQTPAFGSEGLFVKDTKQMLIMTQGGHIDAKEACMKYHPGCRVVAVLDKLARADGLEDKTIAKEVEKLGGYK